MMRGRPVLEAALVAAVLSTAPAIAQANDKVHLLVIGNNDAFAEQNAATAKPALPLLHFADDDAVAFYELLAGSSDSAHLLTLMDAETEGHHPQLTTKARPPSMQEVRQAVAEIGRRIEANRSQGYRNVVYIFFSGHGAVEDGKGPTLALLDGGISHSFLYDEILAKLPGDYVHLFVDACHAEAVVRPRDASATTVPISAGEANALLVRSTLARFPRVGAIVAASNDSQAHEWDVLGQGVFTHELLSALRGAADVNHDGRIEYSEIYAFLGAANRGIDDARARPNVVAHPPETDRRVAVVQLSQLSPAGTAELRGVPASVGLVKVEDVLGRRLVTLRGEQGFVADLVVPAGKTYVQTGDKEAVFESRPGQVVPFQELAFRAAGARPRGALEQSVRRGLFASQFGRGYYLGFIDQAPDFVPVSFADSDTLRVERDAAVPPTGHGATTPHHLVVAGAGVSSTVARAFDVSGALRLGLRPPGSHGWVISLDLARASAASIDELRATLAAGWLWSVPLGAARGWAAIAAGGGFIRQREADSTSRWSGAIKLGPSVGVAAAVTRHFGLWGEAELAALAYRLDNHAAASLTPMVLGGLSLAL